MPEQQKQQNAAQAGREFEDAERRRLAAENAGRQPAGPAQSTPRATHYVVTADMIGNGIGGRPALDRGQVVSADALGDDVHRLVLANAVRPASPDESTQTRVTVTGRPPPASYEQILADRRKELDAAGARIADLTAEVAHLRGLAGKGAGQPQGGVSPELAAQKDRVIEDLQRDNAALKEQLAKQAEAGEGERGGKKR